MQLLKVLLRLAAGSSRFLITLAYLQERSVCSPRSFCRCKALLCASYLLLQRRLLSEQSLQITLKQCRGDTET